MPEPDASIEQRVAALETDLVGLTEGLYDATTELRGLIGDSATGLRQDGETEMHERLREVSTGLTAAIDAIERVLTRLAPEKLRG